MPSPGCKSVGFGYEVVAPPTCVFLRGGEAAAGRVTGFGGIMLDRRQIHGCRSVNVSDWPLWNETSECALYAVVALFVLSEWTPHGLSMELVLAQVSAAWFC